MALNGTLPITRSSVLFSFKDLTDGDHQLDGLIQFPSIVRGLVMVDYLEYVPPLFHSVLRVLR